MTLRRGTPVHFDAALSVCLPGTVGTYDDDWVYVTRILPKNWTVCAPPTSLRVRVVNVHRADDCPRAVRR